MFEMFFKNWNRKKLKNKKYDFLFDEPKPNEYVCLDCETSGLNPKKDEILSIGAVHIKENKILMRKTFNIFLKPSKHIDAESIKIHHIRQIDLENGIDPEIAIYELLEFIGSRPIVGYYIKFDVSIISKYTKRFIFRPSEELSNSYFLPLNTKSFCFSAFIFTGIKYLFKESAT